MRKEKTDMTNDLIVSRILFHKDRYFDPNAYPFNIPCLKEREELQLSSPVSIFIGENGSGKSTLLEAVAIAAGCPAEGGTVNFRFETRNTSSVLSEYITLVKKRTPSMKFFLRAETFYNFSSEIERLVEENSYGNLYNSYGGSLHEVSHGQSFLRLIQNRFQEKGFYILDEPEAALSPTHQLSFLYEINRLAHSGAQFLIATHSPIISAYREAVLYDMDNAMEQVSYKDTSLYQQYSLFLKDPERMQELLFREE